MKGNIFLAINNEKCIQCLQCLRNCSVNAIGYVNNKLFIHPLRCIKCGSCYDHCPSGAISSTDHIADVKQLISHNKIVIASIAPTWVSEFRGISMNQIIISLKKLGFTHVSQAALGATIGVEQTKKRFSKEKPLVISSICPVANRLIETHYPQFINHLNTVSTPETLHYRLLKSWYGEEAKVVYISSCIASQENNEIDGAISFKELQTWLESEEIDFRDISPDGENSFEPFLATGNHGYQLINSAIDYFPEVDVQSASGVKRVKNMLDDIKVEEISDNVYLELFACEGGCLTSVGSIDKNNMLAKKLRFDKHIRDGKRDHSNSFPEIDICTQHKERTIRKDSEQQEKESILRKMNISQSGSLLNCSACGYQTCDDFANAVVLKMAEINTCVWHQKNSLSTDLSSIIERIPYGFFIVNKNMYFEKVNEIFSKSIGVEKDVILSKKIPANRLISFSAEIEEFIANAEEQHSYDVLINGREMRLNLCFLQKGEMVFGELKNILSTDGFSDEYVESVKRVIRDNVSSVQQIAYLLGENLSRTESLISSITENKE